MPGASGTGRAKNAGGVRLIEMNEHLKKDILSPVFWGFIVALICLPFYLFMAVPQIGRSFNVATVHAFLMPIIAAFLASAMMGDRDMKSSLIMLLSSAIFLTVGILIVLLLPQSMHVVFFVDTYYINVAQKMIMAFIMFFPSLLIGSITGKVFGDAYVSDITRAERRELNEEMREWKETLEKAIDESDKGNSSDENTEGKNTVEAEEERRAEEKPRKESESTALKKED